MAQQVVGGQEGTSQLFANLVDPL